MHDMENARVAVGWQHFSIGYDYKLQQILFQSEKILNLWRETYKIQKYELYLLSDSEKLEIKFC